MLANGITGTTTTVGLIDEVEDIKLMKDCAVASSKSNLQVGYSVTHASKRIKQ